MDLLEAFDRLNSLYESILYESIAILDYKNFNDLLINTKINNARFDKAQFEKHYDNNHKFYCLIENNILLAAASIQQNKLGLNDLYINEIQSFQKGYGQKLIQELLNYNNIWLMAEPGNKKLITYYRQFNLNEFVLAKNESIYDTDTYYFYKDLDPQKFEVAIRQNYGK